MRQNAVEPPIGAKFNLQRARFHQAVKAVNDDAGNVLRSILQLERTVDIQQPELLWFGAGATIRPVVPFSAQTAAPLRCALAALQM